jgi:hypothetical protein
VLAGTAPALCHRMEEPGRGDELPGADRDDVLAPFVGIVRGALLSFPLWLLLVAAVIAVYQSAPWWIAATVQTVLVAARRAVS